jgi:hypothetical protein
MTYTRIIAWAYWLALMLLLTACSPAPQAQGQLPYARPNDNVWTLVPMTGGPAVYTACIKGNRVYAMDSLLVRASEWTSTGPKSMAAVQGC